MLDECCTLLLGELPVRRARLFVDATFGAGGHSAALLERDPSARIIALDADPAAVARGATLAPRFADRLAVVHANYADLGDVLEQRGVTEVDGVLFDCGLSSLQLADESRGFGLDLVDAPLDMRLDPRCADRTAADIVNHADEQALADLIFHNADERLSRRIARQIVRRRERAALRTTSDLVAAVLSAQPRGARRGRVHPATRTFQALRMAVNDELPRLERGMREALQRVRFGGRVVALSFHSGEDRVVKRTFADAAKSGAARLLTRKPLRPSPAEAASNPRSRSAKLRAVEIVRGA